MASLPRPVQASWQLAARTAARVAAGGRAAAVAFGAAVVVPAGPASAAPAASPTATAASAAAVSTADAERQAALVAAEDRRVLEIRSVAAVAALTGTQWSKPYRLSTGSGYTLVLTARGAKYTLADLLALAPQTFVRQPDGSYLLLENIYLNAGAKLQLSNPGGLTIHLVSNNSGFVSIISFGGVLSISGTEQAPVKIDSWDPRTKQPDTVVSDGRAYVRAIGGQFTMTYAHISHLGFWSGRTGGIGLTGTDRPNTGSTQSTQVHGNTARDAAKQKAADSPAQPNTTPNQGDVLALPSGNLTTPDTRFGVADQSYVSVKITNSQLTGNAFGLFISGANGVQVSDSVVQHSLLDGVVLHRYASNGVLDRVVSKLNGRDGFRIARATEEIRISASTASGNAGNGYTFSGRALADGPSAAGESTAIYGNNSVSNSTARDNGHDGIEVDGGLNVGIQNNQVIGGDMGIVASRGAHQVAIVGNQLSQQRWQAISLRDGVVGATVTGNIIAAGQTGIYLRDSVATVRGNTVDGVTRHGVSVVGSAGGSSVSYNVISGMGPTALDLARAHGKVKTGHNQTANWRDTRSLLRRLRSMLRPMTLIWLGVLLLIMVSAVRARKARRGTSPGAVHPYQLQRPLDLAPASVAGAASNINDPTVVIKNPFARRMG